MMSCCISDLLRKLLLQVSDLSKSHDDVSFSLSFHFLLLSKFQVTKFSLPALRLDILIWTTNFECISMDIQNNFLCLTN